MFILPFTKYENKIILGRWGRHLDKKPINKWYDYCIKG